MHFNAALETAGSEWTHLKPQDAMDLACLRAEIHLFKGQDQLAAEVIQNIPVSTTSSPRVLALHSRMTAIAGDLDGARETLDQALDAFQEHFDPMPSNSAQDSLRKVMNLVSIAEAAMTINDLPLSVDLLSRTRSPGVRIPSPGLAVRHCFDASR